MTRFGRTLNDGGQALIELLCLIPILVICGLVAMQGLVAGANVVSADSAAHAGALAAQAEGDVDSAVRAAVPGWSRGRVAVRARGSVVEVTLRPRSVIPGVARLLVVRSSARTVRLSASRERNSGSRNLGSSDG